MAIDAKVMAAPSVLTGSFTSAGAAVAVTETLGFAPSLVYVYLNITTGTPNMLMKTVANTGNTVLTTGATGNVTVVADASGLLLTAAGFTVPASVQTNSGVNSWIAFR